MRIVESILSDLGFAKNTRELELSVLAVKSGLDSTGCCPNENLFERSLKRFLFINLGEVKEKRFQLFESEGRVLESSGMSFRFVKKCFRASEK